MADVRYIDATCCYAGSSLPAVDGLNLDIGDGEFMVLVGPSGSGKVDGAAHARWPRRRYDRRRETAAQRS